MIALHAGFSVRPMQESDLDAVLEIENAAQPTPWSRNIFAEGIASGHDCEVVEKDGQIAGFQVVSRVLDEAHLLNVVIAPAFQRRGLGWALINRLIERCEEKDTSVIFLEVRKSNIAARQLYEHIGFNEIGVRRAYYRSAEGREDAILMMMELVGHK